MFPELEQTYEFSISKEQLKDKLVEAYSYDVALWLKIAGKTLIYDSSVNMKYWRSTTEWLDRSNWDAHKQEIRSSLRDTVSLSLAKHLSMRSIKMRVIIEGDNHHSRLRIEKVESRRARKYSRPKEVYQKRVAEKIENKLIEELN